MLHLCASYNKMPKLRAYSNLRVPNTVTLYQARYPISVRNHKQLYASPPPCLYYMRIRINTCYTQLRSVYKQ
jgi:hypothetical protein